MNYIFTMLLWWVMAGWILDFQYCKWVLNFLQYFFSVKWCILFYFIKKHFPDCHSVHWGINPSPLKNTTPSFLPSWPPLNLQTVQVPFLSNPSSILVFREPSLRVGFFSEPPKYQSFSFLTPSYLLKITKFLVAMS